MPVGYRNIRASLTWLQKKTGETNNYWPSSVMQTLGWDIPEIWSHFSLIRSCKGRIILFLFYKWKKLAELRLKEIIWPNSRIWFSWDSNTGFPDSVSIFFPLKELKWNSLHIVGELGMLLSTKKKCGITSSYIQHKEILQRHQNPSFHIQQG